MAWSLVELLSSMHDEIELNLSRARKSYDHPGTKGDASENVWVKLFNTYLPKRYRAKSAHVVDSRGEFSEQIDVVIFDRQYSPFIFSFAGQTVIPAESIYAVFEVKQAINADMISYAQGKVASVRRLYRTSLPIPTASGLLDPKEPNPIYGGMLTLDNEWKNMGGPLLKALRSETKEGRLDIGCVAAHGYFSYELEKGDYIIHDNAKPATAFLFKLISMLQQSATVPMIDVQEYAKWLSNGT